MKNRKLILSLGYVMLAISIIFLIFHYIYNLNFINDDISFILIFTIIIFCFFTLKYINNESWKKIYKLLLETYLVLWIILFSLYLLLTIFGRMTTIKEYKVNDDITIKMIWYKDMVEIVPPIEIVYKRDLGFGFNCYTIIESYDNENIIDNYDFNLKWNEISDEDLGICGQKLKNEN